MKTINLPFDDSLENKKASVIALLPLVAKVLRQVGHHANRVRDYGVHAAEDEDIFEHASHVRAVER